MKGLSVLVSFVLVIAFGFIAMAIVLAVVNPLLDRAKDSGIINEATQNMQLLDSAVKEIASEVKGSKRTVGIKITEGVLRSNSSNDQVYFDYDARSNYDLSGFAGDVKIESRPVFLEYFNQYSDGANANDSWTSLNGTWVISSGRLQGTRGIVYHAIGNQKEFEFSADISGSVTPNGQVYVVPGDPRDLILFLPLDEGTGTNAYDYSGYGNNATLINSPSWTTGRFGNATQFSGSTDYINVPDSASLDITNRITVEAWVNIP